MNELKDYKRAERRPPLKGKKYEGGGEIGLYRIKREVLAVDEFINVGGVEYGEREDLFKVKTMGNGEFLIWHQGRWINGEEARQDLEKIYDYPLVKGRKSH